MKIAIWTLLGWKTSRFNLTNWKIGRRLGAGFGLMVLVMVAVTAIGVLVLYRTTASIDGLVKQRFPHSVLVNTIKSDFNDVLSNINKVLLDGDLQNAAGPMSSVEQSMQFVAEGMAKLEQAGFLLAEEKQRIAELKAAYASFLPGRAQFAKAVQEGNIEQARETQIREIAPFGMGYMQSLDTMIRQHEELAAAEGERASGAARRALLLMLVLAGTGCVLGVLIAVSITRTITRPLGQAVAVARKVAAGDLTVDIAQGGSDETGMLMRSLHEMNTSLAGIVSQVRQGTSAIGTASFEIASATSSLSQRTEQQADALGQSAAALNQLAGTVGNTAANAGLANQQAQGAAATATRGAAVVRQVVQTMDLIKQSSQRIADIIGVVDAIAFQTNILALNAAVEAARAGDQGRGFAVVAAEVRSLAQRSAASSKEIKALIGESVRNVDTGSALVDSAGRTMDEIMTSVQAVAQLMGEITEASHEQSAGIGAVNLTMQQMDDMTQQNAAMVEEAFGASEELKHQAIELAKAVSVFKLEAQQTDGGDDGIAVDPRAIGIQEQARVTDRLAPPRGQRRVAAAFIQ